MLQYAELMYNFAEVDEQINHALKIIPLDKGMPPSNMIKNGGGRITEPQITDKVKAMGEVQLLGQYL